MGTTQPQEGAEVPAPHGRDIFTSPQKAAWAFCELYRSACTVGPHENGLNDFTWIIPSIQLELSFLGDHAVFCQGTMM